MLYLRVRKLYYLSTQAYNKLYLLAWRGGWDA